VGLDREVVHHAFGSPLVSKDESATFPQDVSGFLECESIDVIS
jgi:hypothetical protein